MKRRILQQWFLAGPLLLLASVGWLLMSASAKDEIERPELERLIKLPSRESELIQLPLRVHLLTGIEMEKDKVAMRQWVTAEDVEKLLLPEINRIWRPAKIQWVLEGVLEQAIDPKGKHRKAISSISKATRETQNRTRLIRSLADPEQLHPTVQNLYLLPYVGATTQGFASFGGGLAFEKNPDGGNYCFVGVWTNKPSRGKKPPQKFPLIERGDFKIGSIARTCSHELGHNLLLQHPDKKTQTIFSRLMGGRRHGDDLTKEEVALARKVAEGRAARILRGLQDK